MTWKVSIGSNSVILYGTMIWEGDTLLGTKNFSLFCL